MSKPISLKMLAILVLAGLLLSACSSIGGATPTEVEIVIDPATIRTEAAATQPPTPTLRPTATHTPEPTAGPTFTPSPTLDPFETLLYEGSQLRTNQQFDAALAKFNEAAQLAPNDPRGYIERGITHNAMGQFDDAIADLNQALNVDPNSVEALNARGISWAQKEQYAQALSDYSKAIELKPDDPKVYNNRAIVYLFQNKTEEALLDFSKVVELQPDNPEGYFNLGQAYMTVMQYAKDVSYADGCIANFNQAIAMLPDTADAYASRASCLIVKEDMPSAYNDYTKAISLDPGQARYYLYRASMYPQQGTIEQAQSDLQKVLELTQDADMRTSAEGMLKDLPTLPTSTPAP